jgi:prophage regulatory protein
MGLLKRGLAAMKLITYSELRTQKGVTYQRDHLRRKCKAAEFPKPVSLSARRIGWIEQEVDDWLAERAAARGHTAA